MNAVLPTPPAPSIPKFPFASRDEIQIRMLHHLELAFNRTPTLRDQVTTFRATPAFLPMFVNIHFRLPSQAAADAVTTSSTVGDLIDKVAELLGVEKGQLF